MGSSLLCEALFARLSPTGSFKAYVVKALPILGLSCINADLFGEGVIKSVFRDRQYHLCSIPDLLEFFYRYCQEGGQGSPAVRQAYFRAAWENLLKLVRTFAANF